MRTPSEQIGANEEPNWSSYCECDTRRSASHCSLIQPGVAEFTVPGTRIREMMTIAIRAMTTPAIKQHMVLAAVRPPRRMSILTCGPRDCLCAYAQASKLAFGGQLS